MMGFSDPGRPRARAGALFVATALWLLAAGPSPVAAHEGPPYAIFVDRAAGPYVLSLWADPDVGIGTFYVMLDAPVGATWPEETRVAVVVQPESGRLPEARHPARRQPSRQRVQYLAEVPFDAEERWRVRLLLEGPRGRGEVATAVDVTPPGLGPFDLILYLAPFVAVGFLWLRAVLVRRLQPREDQGARAATGPRRGRGGA
jgi:hypothetical protein